MGYFPFFTEIKDRPGLIVGGGAVALRKAEKLLPFGPRLTVAAERFHPDFYALVECVSWAGLILLEQAFSDALLDDVDFVIAATDDRALNAHISALCRKRSIPVNVVDDPALCSFFFPALIKQGRLSVGISTEGASPSVAQWLRGQVEELLPAGTEAILDWLADMRAVVKASIPQERERAAVCRQLFAASLAAGRPLDSRETAEILAGEVVPDHCKGSCGDMDKQRKTIEILTGEVIHPHWECKCESPEKAAIQAGAAGAPQQPRISAQAEASRSDAAQQKHPGGRVWLVGAGCGKADLITVRGASLLGQCGAVVYDDLIDKELLELAPPGAERYFMGKRAGRPSARQEEICALLIRLAREGRQVVRLKGGDPCVFGRGGEEAQALDAAGIEWAFVPGVSAAIAIPEEAGIPVTFRGLSRSVHIVTAHAADTPDGFPEDLERLAGLHGTLVFLMGLGRLEELVARLQAAGMPPDTPAAVVSGGNAPNPCTVRAALSELAACAANAQMTPPAVIVVGEVARLGFSR